jgi:hypothetical protein
MGETRRMHFVPRTYLKYFSQKRGDEYYINAIAKEKASIQFETNILNVCAEKDLYLIPGETEKERQFLEKMYKELYEDDYDRIYGILTDNSRDTITLEERYAIIGFVVSTFYRNNVWTNSYSSFINDIYTKAYFASKENNKDSFYFEAKQIRIAGKTLEELLSEGKKELRAFSAITAAKSIFQLIRLRMINDVVTVVKTIEKFEYLTSDNPVTFRGPDIKQRAIPMDPSNTLSLPIDRNHLLQLRPWGHELDRTMLGRMTEHPFMSVVNTEMNNQFQFCQVGKFLLGSESGIKNFKFDPSGELMKAKIKNIES